MALKIVQAIGWYFPENVGGTEVYVRGLARILRASGHDVTIVAPHVGSEERRYQHEGIDVYRYPLPDALTRDEAQGRRPVRGTERLHRCLSELAPDVVHFHTFVSGLGLDEVCAAKAAGARVIVTTHSAALGFLCQRGTMMRWGERICDGLVVESKCAGCELQHRGVPKPIAAALGRVPQSIARAAHRVPGPLATGLGLRDLIAFNRERQRRMFDVVDYFVVLTDWAARAVVANGAPRSKVVVNRLGIDSSLLGIDGHRSRAAAAAPIRVGYVGRYDQIKGVEVLARAAASLPSDSPVLVEFRGPINGERDKRMVERLRSLAAMSSGVFFAPAIPTSEMASVLRHYDAVCCPSLCLEGGPTVALEAVAVGTPVIGSNVGGLAEIVQDGINGRLLPPGDVNQLARALGDLAVNPQQLERWRVNLPRPRSLDDVAGDYLRLYGA